LLRKYNASPSLLLSSVYSDYNWLPWKFTVCPQHYWDDKKNQRKFMDWAANELKINEMSDWYNASFKVTCYHKIKLSVRISRILVALAFYELNTTLPILSCFLSYSQSTSGYHGNSIYYQNNSEMTRNLRENSWIGQGNSWV
jgi:uncharacterized radical SAM superfamily Fe-S cluster-containing enzyme